MLSGYAQKLQQSAQVQAEAAKAVSGIFPKVAESLDAADLDALQQVFAKLELFNREAREFNDRSLAQILAAAQQLEQELKTYTATLSLTGDAANTDHVD